MRPHLLLLLLAAARLTVVVVVVSAASDPDVTQLLRASLGGCPAQTGAGLGFLAALPDQHYCEDAVTRLGLQMAEDEDGEPYEMQVNFHDTPPFPGCFYNVTSERAFYWEGISGLSEEPDQPPVSFRAHCDVDDNGCRVLCQLPQCTHDQGDRTNAQVCGCGHMDETKIFQTAIVTCGGNSSAGQYCRIDENVGGVCSRTFQCQLQVDGACAAKMSKAARFDKLSNGQRDANAGEQTKTQCQCGKNVCKISANESAPRADRQNYCYRSRSQCSHDPDQFSEYPLVRRETCAVTPGLSSVAEAAECVAAVKRRYPHVRRVRLKRPSQMNTIDVHDDNYPPQGCSMTAAQHSGSGCGGSDAACESDGACMCAIYYQATGVSRNTDCSEEFGCLCKFEGAPCPKHRGREPNTRACLCGSEAICTGSSGLYCLSSDDGYRGRCSSEPKERSCTDPSKLGRSFMPTPHSATGCEICKVGKYGNQLGTRCLLCPRGMYQDEEGHEECVPCSEGNEDGEAINLCTHVVGATTSFADNLQELVPLVDEDDAFITAAPKDGAPPKDIDDNIAYPIYAVCSALILSILLVHRNCPRKFKSLDLVFARSHCK